MTNETQYNQIKTAAHAGLGNVSNSMKELWLEIGGSCHLRCDYCFAKSGGIDTCKDNVSLDKVLGYLNEFKDMGGQRIGIVGAGEPFHAKNIEDTFTILEQMKPTGVYTTIFTTGDLLTDKVIDRLDNYKNLTLLVKYNSDNAQIQDGLVHSKNYTQRRDEALNKLISRGYNDGKRLGIVTSLMTENINEMADLLRYARKNNLIFDSDTLIPRGRGSTCGLDISDEQKRNVLKELQRVDREEFNNTWEITGSYIASPPCTRFSNHMYIDKIGKVHPCVSSQGVVVGDIKTQTLNEIWNSPIMGIIRGHNYVGKCTTCNNFKEKKCFSCLGRACDPDNMTTDFLKENKHVQTRGCFNFVGNDNGGKTK
jgi:MoaA/NifB/PqqE/SkfB family radical SAM enzyme